jgi:drug/metabolite transporter (DMT)-like permease
MVDRMRHFDWYEILGLVAVILGMVLMGWIYYMTREVTWQLCLVIVTGIILLFGIVFKERLRDYLDPNYELLKIPEKQKL